MSWLWIIAYVSPILVVARIAFVHDVDHNGRDVGYEQEARAMALGVLWPLTTVGLILKFLIARPTRKELEEEAKEEAVREELRRKVSPLWDEFRRYFHV